MLRPVRTLCFPRTLEGFSLQAFLSMTRYLNFCRHFRTLKSFFLLTYLLTYLLTIQMNLSVFDSHLSHVYQTAGVIVECSLLHFNASQAAHTQPRITQIYCTHAVTQSEPTRKEMRPAPTKPIALLMPR